MNKKDLEENFPTDYISHKIDDSNIVEIYIILKQTATLFH